jgi:hypothetical protein
MCVIFIYVPVYLQSIYTFPLHIRSFLECIVSTLLISLVAENFLHIIPGFFNPCQAPYGPLLKGKYLSSEWFRTVPIQFYTPQGGKSNHNIALFLQPYRVF